MDEPEVDEKEEEEIDTYQAMFEREYNTYAPTEPEKLSMKKIMKL